MQILDIDCNNVSWFEGIWYCWDVPNWLTLVGEIIVAIILGYIFLRKGGKFDKELKKIRDSQKTWADLSIMFSIEDGLKLMNILEKDYENVSTNQMDAIEKTLWEKHQKTINNLIIQLDSTINHFGTALPGDTIVELRNTSNKLKSLTSKPISNNTECIFHIRRNLVHTSKKLSIGIIPDLQELLDDAWKKFLDFNRR